MFVCSIVYPPFNMAQIASTEKARETTHSNKLRKMEMLRRSVLAHDPNSPVLHGELGQVLLREGKYEESVEELGVAVQQLPESRAYNMDLAESLIGWGHFAVAVDFLKAVQPNFQQYPEFHYDMGLAEYNLNQIREALPEFEEASRMAPSLDRAKFFVAACRASTGDLKGAAQVYRSLVRDHPANTNYWLALGQVLDGMDESDRPEALHACRHALALRPGDPSIEFRISIILMQMDNYAAARPLLEHIVKLEPNDTATHAALARTYSHLGEHALAHRQSEIVTQLEKQKTENSANSPKR